MTNISPHAIVQTTDIGQNVSIGEFAIIRPNVRIGNDAIIHPHVVIESGVEIGSGVEIFPGAYIGKEPKGAGILARTPTYECVVKVGDLSSIGPHVVIYYDVCVGSSSLIGDGASIREQCFIGDQTVIGRYVTINYNTKIGNEVKIMDHTWLAGNMTIKDKVFVSGGVLTANDHHMGDTYEAHQVVGPTIHQGAAIGVGATILPFVEIGEFAVVGAQSLVTKNVEPKTLVMGIPAKFVRKLEDS
jgi:UDP-3-O-[3-hydroxymyristoyl] glucosamine N-acyltransferase